MATTFSSTHRIVCSSAPLNPSKPDPTLRSKNNWWAPIFGLSSEPDYINVDLKIESDQAGISGLPENEMVRVRPDKNLFKGCFSEEKAKELRKKTIESYTFHDIMYHSSIASRLASDVSGRYGC